MWPAYGCQLKAGGPAWTTEASLARLADVSGTGCPGIGTGCTGCTGCRGTGTGCTGTGTCCTGCKGTSCTVPAARKEGAAAWRPAKRPAAKPLPSHRPQAATIAATDTELHSARAAAEAWFSALGSTAPPAGRSAARLSRLRSSGPAAAARGPGTTAAAAHNRATPSASLGFFTAGSSASTVAGPSGVQGDCGPARGTAAAEAASEPGTWLTASAAAAASAAAGASHHLRCPRMRPRRDRRPASPSGQACPSRCNLGTGHLDRPACPACCAVVCSPQRLHLKAPACSWRSCNPGSDSQPAAWHGLRASSTALELSEALLPQIVHDQSPANLPLTATHDPCGGHGAWATRLWRPAAGATSACTASRMAAAAGQAPGCICSKSPARTGPAAGPAPAPPAVSGRLLFLP